MSISSSNTPTNDTVPNSAKTTSNGPSQPPSNAPLSGDKPAQPPIQPASLYVGELDPSVTEANLFEIFNMVGPVASIRVCRDAVTRKSLGYGYVNYHSTSDGERALETLNYTPIKGKACRMMWSHRDPTLRKTGQGNIFIKNLDTSIDNKALHDTFSAFGNILSCKVATEDGKSKGYGFVHFETHEAAEEAIKNVNGMLLNDKPVFVGYHVSRKERESKEEVAKNNFTNIYVKNIDTSYSEDKLREIFEKFGSINSLAISKDDQGVSKGFAFINYDEVDSAKKAIEELHDKEIEGKKMYVSRAQKKSEREDELKKAFEQLKLEKASKYQGSNLYVKNLNESIDDEKFRQEFEQFGEITSAKIMRDEKDVSRGFGFVCFSTPEEATQALTKMNGKVIGDKPCYIAYAQRKEDRRSLLEQQAAQRNQMRIQAAGGMFPGNPMYYPGMNAPLNPGFPPAQRGMMYPQQAGVPHRPRYPNPQMQQNQMPPVQFPPNPQMYNNMRGMRPRPGARGMPPMPRGYQNVPPQQIIPPKPQPLDPSTLASLPPEQQKQTIGEQLYPLVFKKQPELAGKITGMLLDMDNGELLNLIEEPSLLDTQIKEAVEVLNQHQHNAEPKQ